MFQEHSYKLKLKKDISGNYLELVGMRGKNMIIHTFCRSFVIVDSALNVNLILFITNKLVNGINNLYF